MEKIYKIVPAFDALRNYRLPDLRSDVLAGLTVAAVAVPQAMAYGMVAGVPPEYGLYTAIIMTAVGALFDSSRQLINGPTNATSIAALSALAGIATMEGKIQGAVLLAFLMGAFQISITLLRLGDLTRYISHSVIVGFTLGAGMLLLLDQLKNLFGMKAMGDVHDHFLMRFYRTMTEGGGLHAETLLVGLGTIGLILALRWLKNRMNWRLLPEFLITLVVMASLAAGLDLEAKGVRVVGEIPAKLPHFQVPTFDWVMMRDLAGSALAIATLGLLEAISMAKAIAAQTRQKLDMNQQCLSEGLANFTGSFFQCIPGSGSLTRSAINQQAGAISQWSGVISAIAVAGIMLMFGSYARYIPRAALAGILVVSVWRMVDRHALIYHIRASRFDAVIVGVTAFSAVAISVEFCVLIGIFMSFLLAVPRASRMLLTEFVVAPDNTIHERNEEDKACDRVLIFGLEGEMFFGASSVLEQHLELIEARVVEHTKVVVLRMKRIRSPDAVCMHLIDAFLHRMDERGIKVIMCGVRSDFQAALKRTRIAGRLSDDQVFVEQPVRHSSTAMAVRHAFTLAGERCDRCPLKLGPPDSPLYYVV